MNSDGEAQELQLFEQATKGGYTEFKQLIGLLRRLNVNWCLIGDAAVNAYVEPIYMADVDYSRPRHHALHRLLFGLTSFSPACRRSFNSSFALRLLFLFTMSARSRLRSLGIRPRSESVSCFRSLPWFDATDS